ncbi:hypothetical protein [Paenibacillus dendritiformis]|uniref:hypothetical protein n=1 Tax=Paenibacillus dendritiformis TaxID=130049 RepID=UPI000DA88301|nr:hypothetical protein [Paenibacillus dendritiformis]PZM63480.1 hypothetical protein DOE73_21815 [Paenibacillus dendritiformis]
MNKTSSYAHRVWPGAPTTPEEDRDELVYSKRDIDGQKSAMVIAVAKREEEIARLRKMYEREREIAEQWKTAAENQQHSNYTLIQEVERLKGQLKTVETSKHILVEQLTDEVSLHARSSARVEVLQSQLQDALKVMQEAIDDIDCEYPQTARISLRKAIQRIQEASNDKMPS